MNINYLQYSLTIPRSEHITEHFFGSVKSSFFIFL